MKFANLAAVSAACLIASTAANAQLSWNNVYGTLGVSYVDLQRDASPDPLITRDNKNGAGVSLGIGYQLHSKFGVELSRHDLGTVRETDAGVGGPNYSDQSAIATVVAVKVTPWTEGTFVPFGKLGAARIQVAFDSTDGTALSISRDRAYAALGVDYLVTKKVKVGLMYEHFWSTAGTANPPGEPPRMKPRGLSLTSSISF